MKKKDAKKMFLLFNHSLTHDQKEEAQTNWGVSQFIPLPPELQKIWAQIPSDKNIIAGSLTPILEWLDKNSQKTKDLVLIQGDFGATFFMVNYALEKQLIPVYSVTQRDASEKMETDGRIKNIHFFKHRMFRAYEK